jgi:hypothetical protein
MPDELFAQAIQEASIAGRSLDDIDAEIIEPALLSAAPEQLGRHRLARR